MASKSVGINLSASISREYKQWQFLEQLKRQLKEDLKDFKLENHRNRFNRLENQFGRWLMTMQFFDWRQLDQTYPLLPHQPLANSGASKKELVRTLLESCFVRLDEQRAEAAADKLLLEIKRFLQLADEDDSVSRESAASSSVEINATYLETKTAGRIVIGDFKTPKSNRIRLLVQTFGLENTALACLRYSPLNHFRGQESGFSVKAMTVLHDLGQATYEGFASPLNASLLGRRPDAKFCSLFGESTDAAFGSLGSFFGVKLANYPGGWVLNPPHIEPLLSATAHRVVEQLSASDTEPSSHWFYILIPFWDDHEAWQLLDRCQWNAARWDLEPSGDSIISDCYGTPLYQHTKLCLFVIGEPPKEVNLSELRDRLIIKSK